MQWRHINHRFNVEQSLSAVKKDGPTAGKGRGRKPKKTIPDTELVIDEPEEAEGEEEEPLVSDNDMIDLGEYELLEGGEGEDFDEELFQLTDISQLFDFDQNQPEGEGEGEEEEEDAVALMNGYFGIPGLIHFSRGEGDLPRVFLKHPYSESAAEIYLHGAAITQWLRPDGSHALAARPDARYDGVNEIESGVKLCFPQHREGRYPEDGFANKMQWEVVAAGLDFLPFGDGFTLLHPDEDKIKELLHQAETYKAELAKEEREAAGAGPGGSEGGSSGGGGGGGKMRDGVLERPKGIQRNPTPVEVAEVLLAKAKADQEALERGEELDPHDGEFDPVDSEEQIPHQILPWEVPGAFGFEMEPETPEEGELDPDTPPGHVEPGTNDLDVYTRLIKKMWDTGRDPAPYVTLRLRDCEETRAMGWNHKFELLYKITLMENDDFEDLTPSPSQESFTTATEGSDILKATIEKQEEILKVLETNVAAPPDPEMEEAGLKEDPRLKPSLMGAKEEFGEDVGKDALEDQYEIDPEYDDEGEEGEGPALVPKVPLQLRMQLRLVNKDEEGQEPMSFQVAQLVHIATRDMTEHGDFIRIRGLGGSHMIDYAEDERRPKLSIFEEDYINFFGQRIDSTFVNAAAADVSICPGDRSHFELIPREGFKDMVVYHPGTLRSTTREDSEHSPFWAALGPARVSIPHTLAPGGTWFGEFVLRFHDKYWPDAIWGDEDMMKPIDDPSAAQLKKDSTAPENMDKNMNYTGWGGLEE